MAILVIGSSNTDFNVHVECMPKAGQTVLGRNFSVDAGGKGANQAVGAVRLGAEVTFSCMLGNDDYGARTIRSLNSEGIDTSSVFICPDEASGVALITVDENGENCIVVASGANMRFTPSDVDKIGDFRKYNLVLAQLEIPLETVLHIAELCSEHGVPFILNPAPARQLPDDIFGKISVITPNETEAEILTGIRVTDGKSAEAAARFLTEKGAQAVVITLGCKGSYIYCDGRGQIVPAFKADAVDTTAAGDIFNAAFCVARSRGSDMFAAAEFASAASAIAVTRNGAQSSAPRYEEVIEFIQNRKK